ncbi:phosphotransferase family protein [Pseudonocardia lacus]|uniref:phosphotransferase family protein n=1 Tax=Pseudonocardia lacus TaxID=2835865 RepID=UPI001BDC5ECF|nr:phosphotransferase family protein [Pseudonocardia lacus]
MTQAPPPEGMKLRRSSRDPREVPDRLAAWLGTVLPPGADPVVAVRGGLDANGLSSETLLVDITWSADGRRELGRYVARVAPTPEDVPVFPTYAMRAQYDTIRIVGERSDVPVPGVRWLEPTGRVLGSPFFLMDRVEGVVPQDVLPYSFGDNWLFDATAEQQRALQDRTVEVLATLHAIPDAPTTFAFLDPDHPGGSALARNLARTAAWYEFAAAGVGRSPLVERALAWLRSALPDPDETVLSWGDSRIGNVLYRDFAPVGVLDWEMATVGPRELDVSWLVFAHRVFESLSAMLGLPGMPDFLREDDVVAEYERLTGARLDDLTWYHVHNSARWGIVFLRTGARQIHFGEIERPDDVESLMHNRTLMEALLAEVGA